MLNISADFLNRVSGLATLGKGSFKALFSSAFPVLSKIIISLPFLKLGNWTLISSTSGCFLYLLLLLFFLNEVPY